MTTCTIDNCQRPHHARSMCRMHYYRWKTRGTVEPRPLQVIDGPGICECPTPQPDTGWGRQCTHCWHPIVALHPRLAPALDHWPELANQVVA